MKRFLSAVMIALMLLSGIYSLFSCADSGEMNRTDITGTVTNEWLDNLPEGLYFNGESYDVAITGNSAAHGDLAYDAWVADEATGDAVSQEVFKRNKKIEERLGIKINIAYTASPCITQTSLYTALQAGTDDYDLVCGTLIPDITVGSQGLFVNLNDYNDYIDLSAEYWGAGLNSEYDYKGYLGYVTGSLSLHYSASWYCVFTNLDLYNKYLFTDYGSIYDIVRKKEWTMDLFMEMIEKVYVDSGDIQDKEDKNDILGLLNTRARFHPLASGMGVKFSARNTDGTISIILNGNTAINAAEKLIELEQTKGALILPGGDNIIMDFASGKCLFMVETFANAKHLLEMESEFGLVPMPMYDKSQGDYATTLSGWMQHYGVPTSAPDYVMSISVLEALCAESYRGVMRAWYDEALKYRYSRDDDTAEMIDTIRKSGAVDFATAYSQDIGNICLFFESTDLSAAASNLKSQTRQWNKQLSKILERYDQNCFDE